MPEIVVTVKNKMAVGDGSVIVCNNSDYVVRFVLDSEWDALALRTMRIVYDSYTHTDIAFSGDTVALPAIIDRTSIGIGLYSGDIHTSTCAMFDCERSVMGKNSNAVAPPSSDVYNEIVEMINGGRLKGDKGEDGTNGADGANGADGVTFTPSVDSAGNLSWTNDGGLSNPATVNIKGDKGSPGADGAPGADGSDANVTAQNIQSALGYTPADKVVVDQLSEEIVEQLYIESINLFDASKQTEETISPHYWVNGAPYQTTQFDNSYHCTAPVPVEENTQYALGCVPAITWGSVKNMVKPWSEASQGVFFFSENDEYIGGTRDNIFVTPEGTKYIRFNFFLIWRVISENIKNLIGACMLVKGSALPVGYIPYGLTTIKDNIGELEKKKTTFPVRFVASGSAGTITVASRYSAENDIMVQLKKKGGNNIFDFSLFALIGVGTSISDNLALPNKTEVLMNTATDWHAPFQIKALENVDGDMQDVSHFTGGNHDYTNSGTGGTPTGRTAVVRFIADGAEVVDGEGYCNVLEILWTNYVQAMNTKKADGTGREVLVERHRMTFDGREWKSQVEIEPLEAINMVLYYGLQACGGNSLYNHARYYGGVNRLEYDTSNENTSSGNKEATAIRWHGDTHEVIMTIDPTFDIGSREFYSGTSGLFTTSYGKAYANFFTNKQMQPGEIYSLRGAYVFRPYLGD